MAFFTFENNLNRFILLSHCYFLKELGAGVLLKFSLFFFTTQKHCKSSGKGRSPDHTNTDHTNIGGTLNLPQNADSHILPVKNNLKIAKWI